MNRDPGTADIRAAAAQWVVRRDVGLTPAEETEFQAWLTADVRHLAAVEEYNRTWSQLDRPFKAGQGTAMVVQLGTRARRRGRRRITLSLAAAAALVLIAVRFEVRRPATEAPSIAAAPTAVIVKPEQRVLEDGTVVELRPGTRMTVAFDESVRRVTLHGGEAFFQVAKNPSRPFVVSADGIATRDVATEFAVAMETGKVEVVVREGRVAVGRQSVPAPASFVSAGNRATVGLADRSAPPVVERMSADELEQRLSWLEPHVDFSGTPVAAAVEVINRYAADAGFPKLVVGDEKLGQQRISGFVRLGNSDAFVRLLQASFGVTAERNGGFIVLRSQDLR